MKEIEYNVQPETMQHKKKFKEHSFQKLLKLFNKTHFHLKK